MNKVLQHLYQTGVEKMAHTLDDISAADFLAAVNNGEIDINDFLGEEKVASENELQNLSDEELYNLLEEIETAEGSFEKEAGDFDLNNLSVEEFIQVAAHLEEEMDKEAGVDLNELSVEEFIQVASHLEQEMAKEAKVTVQGVLRKLPGVKQIERGLGHVKSTKGLTTTNPGQSLTDKGTASKAFKRRTKNPEATRQQQIDSMLSEGYREAAIGGAKALGTVGAGGLALYGGKKAVIG